MTKDRGYTDEDMRDVSDNPEWTDEELATAKPLEHFLPDLAASAGSRSRTTGITDSNGDARSRQGRSRPFQVDRQRLGITNGRGLEEGRRPLNAYIALIHKEPDSDFGVSFPDLPGCVTAGTTLDEARVFAREALGLHLEGLAEDGESAPKASTFEAIMADPDNRDAIAVLVEVAEPARAG